MRQYGTPRDATPGVEGTASAPLTYSTRVPLEPPLTLEEEADRDKARALRAFENQEKLDFERDFRDFLDAR